MMNDSGVGEAMERAALRDKIEKVEREKSDINKRLEDRIQLLEQKIAISENHINRLLEVTELCLRHNKQLEEQITLLQTKIDYL